MKNPFEEYPIIKFEDIRKGDTIASVKYDQNALKVSVGLADRVETYSTLGTVWYTEGGAVTVAVSSSINDLYLIDRPKTELPTEAGAVIFIKKYDGAILSEPAVAFLDSADDWFVPEYNKHRSIGVKEWIMTAKDKEKIEEWTPAVVKEVSA